MTTRGARTVGRNFNDFKLDRLDSCSEVTLGICSMFCIVAVMVGLVIPFFDVGVMVWIRTWEGHHNLTMSDEPPLIQGPSIEIPIARHNCLQLDTVAQMFLAADVNQDGLLSRPEIRLAACPSQALPTILSQAPFKEAFKKADADEDGLITRKEAEVLLSICKEENIGGGHDMDDATVVMAFADTDHNGWVSADDIINSARLPALRLELKSGLSRYFGEVDTDGDGYIDKNGVDTLIDKLKQPDAERIARWRALQYFRQAAMAWADGDMKLACQRLDIDGSGTISKFELTQTCGMIIERSTVETETLKQELSPDDPSKACTKMDSMWNMMGGESDEKVTLDECGVGLEWLQHQLQLFGGPHEVMNLFDHDRSGALSFREFAHIGQMSHPQLTEDRMHQLAWLVDTNKDTVVEAKEMAMLEQCGNPAGCPTTYTKEYCTEEDLAAYMGKPAVIQGRMEIRLVVPSTVECPADTVLGEVVGKHFMSAFNERMGEELFLQSSSPYHRSEAQKAAQGDVFSDHEDWVKYVAIQWEIDADDGGAFQQRLRDRSDTMERELLKGFKASDQTWLMGATANVRGQCTAQYYKGKLPDSNTLNQEFGHGEDGQHENPQPFYYINAAGEFGDKKVA